jgi:cell division protein FtsN
MARRPRGAYTIQLAAYNTKPEAERLVARLATQGVNARVSGTTKPFRVRLGFHASRPEAQDEVNRLRARGIIGFVATESPPPEGKTP